MHRTQHGATDRAFPVSDAVECTGVQMLKGQGEHANMPTNPRYTLSPSH